MKRRNFFGSGLIALLPFSGKLEVGEVCVDAVSDKNSAIPLQDESLVTNPTTDKRFSTDGNDGLFRKQSTSVYYCGAKVTQSGSSRNNHRTHLFIEVVLARYADNKKEYLHCSGTASSISLRSGIAEAICDALGIEADSLTKPYPWDYQRLVFDPPLEVENEIDHFAKGVLGLIGEKYNWT